MQGRLGDSKATRALHPSSRLSSAVLSVCKVAPSFVWLLILAHAGLGWLLLRWEAEPGSWTPFLTSQSPLARHCP